VNFLSYTVAVPIIILVTSVLQSRGSSGSDYSGASSGAFSGASSENLSSAYQQRDSAPSRLTFQDIKAPYLHDTASKLNTRGSSYYGGGGSSGYAGAGGYDTAYKPRDLPLYSGSAHSGKQY